MIHSFKNLFAISAMILAVSTTPTFAAGKKDAKKASAPAGNAYKVDAAASTVTWKGTKVTGAHNGKISVKEGTLNVEGSELKGGDVVIDMTSLTNEDLSDKSFNDKLVGHLKSDDFFGVEKHPTATFKIKSIKALTGDAAGNTHEISGDLTIKGKSNPITFPAQIAIADGGLKAKATLKIDRSKYNVRYGSGKFFQGLGDKLIHDEFELGVDLLAKK